MPTLDNPTDRASFIAPSGGVVAGDLYLVEDTLVFATETADAAAAFVGVHKNHIVRGAPFPAATAAAVGDKLYWDAGNDELTTDASGTTAVNARCIAVTAGDTVDIELTDGVP